MSNAPTNNTPERSDPATAATYNFGDATADVPGPAFVGGSPLTRPVPLALAELMNSGLAAWEPSGLVADDWSIRPATIEGLHAMRRAGFGRLFAWSDWDRSRTPELKRIAEHGSGAEAMAATLLLETDSGTPATVSGAALDHLDPDGPPRRVLIIETDRRSIERVAARLGIPVDHGEQNVQSSYDPAEPVGLARCPIYRGGESGEAFMPLHFAEALERGDAAWRSNAEGLLIVKAGGREVLDWTAWDTARKAAPLAPSVRWYNPRKPTGRVACPPWRDDASDIVDAPEPFASLMTDDRASWECSEEGKWWICPIGTKPGDDTALNWSRWIIERTVYQAQPPRAPGYPYDLQAGRSDMHPLESLGYMINRQNQKLRTGTKPGDFRHDAMPYFYPAAGSSADCKPEDLVKELASGMDRAQEYRDAQRNRRDTLARAGVKVEEATVANPPIYRMSHHAAPDAADTNWRNADRAERVDCSQRRTARTRVTIAILIGLVLIGAFAFTSAVRLLNREPVPIDAVRVR